MYTRDPVSKVVINNEDSYYKAIVARRQDARKKGELENEVNSLKSEIADIKELLQQVLSGKNYG